MKRERCINRNEGGCEGVMHQEGNIDQEGYSKVRESLKMKVRDRRDMGWLR